MTSNTPERDIMQRVIRYERRRTRWWLVAFWVTISALAAFIIISFVAIGTVLKERESLKVLSIFTEDWEIIRQGWFDAFRSIWYDIPRHHLIPAIAAIAVAVIIIVFTRQQRLKIRKKRASIAEYGKKD